MDGWPLAVSFHFAYRFNYNTHLLLTLSLFPLSLLSLGSLPVSLLLKVKVCVDIVSSICCVKPPIVKMLLHQNKILTGKPCIVRP